MRKVTFIKRAMISLLAATFVFSAAACNSGTTGGGNGGGGKQTITVSIPADSAALRSWQAMETAYEALYKEQHNGEEIDVKIESNSSASDYQQKLLTSLAGGVNNVSADVVVANEAGQYLTSCFADYMPYLAQPNPYANNQIWRTTLENAAYVTYGADDELYTLSFDTTHVFIVYDRMAFMNCGLDAAQIKTWDDLVDACEVLSTTAAPGLNGLPYIAMSFGGDRNSMGMPLGWLMRVYSDQYFRDFSEVAHSQSGDYTYDPDYDVSWTAPASYDLAEDATIEERTEAIRFDSPLAYTSNPLRALDAYFNGADGYDVNEFNSNGARWKDMMQNLYRIFGNPQYLNPDQTAYGNALTHMFTGQAGMAVVASDFFVSYCQQTGNTIDQVMQLLGIIELPPMTDFGSDGVGAPASNFTRALGGPNGFFGVLNKSKAQVDRVMDFMMYVFSVQGQNVRLQSLAQNRGSLNGPVLVKGVEIPDQLMYTINALRQAAAGKTESGEDGYIDYFGECDYNPIFLVCNGLKAYNGTYEAHVDDGLLGIYYNYFMAEDKDHKIDVDTCGQQVAALMDQYLESYYNLMGYRKNCLDNVNLDPTV